MRRDSNRFIRISGTSGTSGTSEYSLIAGRWSLIKVDEMVINSSK